MRKLLWICLLLIASIAAKSQEQSEFTVLQWNIWQEGTKVTGGYDAIVDEIIRLKPDFVTFSEVRNYNNTRFCDRIVQSLKAKGETYYSFYSYDSGLLSRHPITDSLTIFPEKDDHGSIYKMTSKIKGHKIAVYTAHLDYLNDAYYNVRGYDGSTWEEIPVPQTVRPQNPRTNRKTGGAPEGLAFKKFFDLRYVHPEAGAHSGGNSHGEHVGAFGGRGLETIDRLKQGLEVAQDLFRPKGNLAQGRVQHAGLVHLKVYAAGLELGDSLGHVKGD
jgi:hypothetical protein